MKLSEGGREIWPAKSQYTDNMAIVYMHQKSNYPRVKSIMSQPVLYRNRAMF